MKHLIIGALALGAVGTAVPAAAQDWRPNPYDYGQPYGYTPPYSHGGFSSRAGQLFRLVDRLLDDDAIDNADARFLRAQVAAVRRLEWRYGRDGLNGWERRDLRARYDQLEDRIRDAADDDDDDDWDDRD